MRDWREKMHNSTAAIIAAITKLHGTSSSPNNNAVVCHVVKAMADIIEIQESINTKLQERLREHHRRLMTTEKTLTDLQHQVSTEAKRHRSSLSSKGSDFESFESSWQEDSLHRVGGKRRRLPDGSSSGEQSKSPDPFVSNSNPTKLQQKALSLHHSKDEIQHRSPVTKRKTPVRSMSSYSSILGSNSIKRKRKALAMHHSEDGISSASEGKLQSSPTCKVKPPFTTADIMQERSQKLKENREKERLQPLPCEKCCRIKFGELKKEHGVVKPDVYQRYTERRGACYHYVHQDEELPADQPRSQLSFDESATQSPAT
ncbi:hypothetical protein FGB62_58g037 [Gracilaria domingensis]|nr:hypothetical protein FGB62_58g037 [Gracilaria domingensis]